MKAMIDGVLRHGMGVAVVAASALLLFWRLGQNGLAAWDEAIYAQVSKEILGSGDWITLHWGYKPWFEKPPLFVWTTAVLYKWFGVNELWSRAGSASSGVGVAALTYLIGTKTHGRTVGLVAVLVLLSTQHFVSSARFATTDMALTFFVYLALYGFIRSWEGDPRWWYLAWVGIALAIMTKGAGGLIAPMAIGACVLVRGHVRATAGSPEFVRGFLLALLIVVPWHVAVYLRNGQVFIDSYVVYHVLERSSRPLEGHTGGPFFYIELLATSFFPWCFLAPFAVAAAVKKNVGRVSQSLVVLAMAATIFLIYTVVRTKLAWYVIPIYPSLALLIAAMLWESASGRGLVRRRGIHAAIAASITALFVLIGVERITPLFHKAGKAPGAQIARVAGEDGDAQTSLIVYSGLGWPSILFYSSRPVIVASSVAEVTGIVTRDQSRAIILDKKDLDELAAHHTLEVVAERDRYVYARIVEHRSRPD